MPDAIISHGSYLDFALRGVRNIKASTAGVGLSMAFGSLRAPRIQQPLAKRSLQESLMPTKNRVFSETLTSLSHQARPSGLLVYCARQRWLGNDGWGIKAHKRPLELRLSKCHNSWSASGLAAFQMLKLRAWPRMLRQGRSCLQILWASFWATLPCWTLGPEVRVPWTLNPLSTLPHCTRTYMFRHLHARPRNYGPNCWELP